MPTRRTNIHVPPLAVMAHVASRPRSGRSNKRAKSGQGEESGEEEGGMASTGPEGADAPEAPVPVWADPWASDGIPAAGAGHGGASQSERFSLEESELSDHRRSAVW